MSSLILIAALLVFLVSCAAAADLYFGLNSMTRLSDVDPLAAEDQPQISIIVPACNEEKNIEQAILSHLQQEYGNLEVIAINDRSTDATGAILEKLKEQHEKLKVIHIEALPDGWMGKAHAMQRGAELAGGKYLLFTDGDIVMDHSTLARAAQHLRSQNLDHLSLIFKNSSPGWLLNSLILESGAGLIQMFRPWLAKKPGSRYFIGVGAFNLVRKSSYLSIGGHESISMHPIDDIMLGKILKKNGFLQDCLLGMDMVVVPWYESVAAMVDGLMKNMLAIINYRFLLLAPLLFGMMLFNVLPLWGAIFSSGPAQLIWVAVVFLKLCAFFYGTRLLAISPWCTLGTLFTPYISLYIVLRAAWLNYRDHGIYWRGTHYPIEKLRRNQSILP